jgi:hypothetical protein
VNPPIEFGFTWPRTGYLPDRKAPMSEHNSDGKITTIHGGGEIFWLGHLCEGKPLVPDVPGTFALRTRCGRYQVPPGGATERQPGQVVTCAECKKLETAESL